MKDSKPTGIKYDHLLRDIVSLLDMARRASARTTNAIMTATYWSVGRRIVEQEQGGESRAEYGEEILKKLSVDLASLLGRGFSLTNLKQFRQFYLTFRIQGKGQTPSDQLRIMAEEKGRTASDQSLILQTPSAISALRTIASHFPLSWSAYVKLLSVKDEQARQFYETESLRGGWTIKQLERQINSQFYERTALSRDKASMLKKGSKQLPEDKVTPEEEISDGP